MYHASEALFQRSVDLADEKTRAAVERVLEICSEAMSNLYRVAPTVAETIPHARDIIRSRTL